MDELSRARNLDARLTLLLQASQALTGALNVETALAEILAVARQLIRADAYAVWRVDGPTRSRWSIAASDGLSDEYRRAAIEQRDGGGSLLDGPIVVESVRAFDPLTARRELYLREGIESLLAVPLMIEGLAAGTVVFYFRTPQRVDAIDVKTAEALGNLAAAAIRNAELFEARDRLREEAQAAERRSAFLSNASTVLAASLDYHQTLRNVAELAVPSLADWCAVDMLDDHGLERVALVHSDPEQLAWARTLPPPKLDDDRGAGLVIRTGKPQARFEVTHEMMDAAARTPEERERWRRAGVTSFICVPLLVRGRSVGALMLSTSSTRRLGPADLALGEELARRAGQAIENAWLYREAQDASRAKDEFLAILSHELRTPLNAIFGWSQLLASGAVDPGRVPHAVEVIRRNARAQIQLVEDLLDLSRIITGRLRLDASPIYPADTLHRALEAIEPAAAAKRVTLDVVVDGTAGPVLGDADRLQQVVWNLLSNAIRHTPAGGTVTLRLAQAGSEIEITVADTGEGIAPDVLPFVFERFRQGDSTVTRRHGGLGLGLSIVRHLVELHGGRVDAFSDGLGQGARFTVRLPLVTHGALSDDLPPPQIPGADANLEELDVLVVDDDEDSREVLAAMLTRRGARVVMAASAEEALAALDGHVPSVIISDISMPGTDGYELIRRVRALGGPYSAVPAIALTAYARLTERAEVLAAGYQLHVPKPVDPMELVATVAVFVRRDTSGDGGLGSGD